MKSIMEYMIEAEESALDNYLNDALYEAESLPFLENAFEDAAVIPATGVVKDSETSPIKEKFSIWNWIKGVIHRIGEFFRRIFGLTKETKDAVNKAASKKKANLHDQYSQRIHLMHLVMHLAIKLRLKPHDP